MAGPPLTLPLISPPPWLQNLVAAVERAATQAAVAAFAPGPGLQLSGSAADQQAYLNVVRREMLRSETFRDLMFALNNDAAHPVNLTIGHNVPGVFVDAFGGGGNQTIDMADLQQFADTPPAAHADAMTQGQNLVHVMAEARQGALGNPYLPSHTDAIVAENRYRQDIGQTSNLLLPPNDTTVNAAGAVVFHFDNGYREEVQVDAAGTTITGITRHNPPAGTP